MTTRCLPRSLALVLLVACGAPATSTDATAEEPGPSPPRVVTEPTRRTEAQRQREAQHAPLARGIADAFPNRIGWYSTLAANWSPDGRTILFGSLRDGTPQIYAGDPARPAEPPRAITSGPERASWATYTADGRYILFQRDHGGDEHYDIWRIGVDGTAPIDLTPERVDRRFQPRLARERPDMVVYSELSLAEMKTRVYVQSIADGTRRLVHTSAGQATHGDVTPDGARCLFGLLNGPTDMVVSELDLQTGALHRIYPPEGKLGTLEGLAYSADYSQVHLTTDEGGETSVVLTLDIATGKEVARYTPTSQPGAVLDVLASPNGEHLIVYVDAGNHGELRVHDPRTLALVRPIEVPLGELKLGTFRPDGRQFSIMMSLPDHPPDVYAVDPERGDVRPLRSDPRPAIDALPPMTTRIAEVRAHDGLSIPVNVYLPATASDAAALPTIVMFHGGPADSAAVRWDPFVRFFVSLGYAVLEPNVRGSRGFGNAYQAADDLEKRADWLKDVEAVNRWARSQPWCDPDRVAVWGASYGGYTTLMALTRQPAAWRAGVDLYGPADLRAFLTLSPPGMRSFLVPEFGDPDTQGALLDEFSPMRDVDKIVAPLFVYAGQNDPRVPRRESDSIVQALRDRDRQVEYMVAADEGHNVERRENQIELLTRTARFLSDAMGTAGAPPR